jgi:hypothetical protein
LPLGFPALFLQQRHQRASGCLAAARHIPIAERLGGFDHDMSVAGAGKRAGNAAQPLLLTLQVFLVQAATDEAEKARRRFTALRASWTGTGEAVPLPRSASRSSICDDAIRLTLCPTEDSGSSR